MQSIATSPVTTRPCGVRSRPLAPRPSPWRCAAEPATKTTDEAVAVATNICKTCGVDLSQKPAGCDGEGRVVGGLGAAVSWWPVKAYKPCPQLSQAGVDYIRKGQPTNEMLFGGVSLGQSGAKTLDAMKEQADKGITVE